MPDLDDVSVILVSYDSGAVIGTAVASVPAPCEVVIVDNASPGGTGFMDHFARPARLVAMPRNAGFGAACNAGARVAGGRFVLFLNPDAVLAPGALERLCAAVARYGTGLFMPAIEGENGRLMRKEGAIFQPVARRRRLREEEIAGDYCTHFVHGAAFLVERATFLEMGGFDERIFLYHEDDDLALRAQARHLPIIVVPDARVVHAGGKSTSPGWRRTFWINREKQRSERYLRHKYRRPSSFSGDLARLLGGCLLAALTLDGHRLMIRAGKLAGLLERTPPGQGAGASVAPRGPGV
ncbi:GT2 family glycosyltransferase [Aquabacter spiritensis]|uniref:GT2 family glycosyltransferase n=1 Tax=Aquabacter spiritensis TaxID=933073 RepID=A0A4R3M4S4_9HYPH|nr:GT2 family glycosyltransferase [Aquabacter spiritensis]